MTAIDRTAYPRPGSRLTHEELRARYNLTETDLTFVAWDARGDIGRLLLAVLLKARQDFGYFPVPGEVHASIAACRGAAGPDCATPADCRSSLVEQDLSLPCRGSDTPWRYALRRNGRMPAERHRP